MRLVKDYYKSIADHKDVNKTVMMLSSSIKGFHAAVNLRLQQETTYNFLWEQDREEVVKVTTQAFLLYICMCLCSIYFGIYNVRVYIQSIIEH